MRRFWIFAKVGLGVGILVVLFLSGRIEFSQLLEVQRPLDILFAQGIWFTAFLVTVVRWQVLLGALGVASRFRDAARLSFLGLLFSQVIPGSTGGDVVKGIQIARERPGLRPQAVLSVLLDRVIGLAALMVIGVVGIFFCPPEVRDDPVLRRLGMLLVFMVLAIASGAALGSWQAFWRHERTQRLLGRLPGRHIIGRLAQALWAMRGRTRAMGLAAILSLISHGMFVCSAILLARGLIGTLPSIADYFFLVPIGQLAFSLPLTPAGVGVGHFAFEELFRSVGETHGAELAVLIQLTAVLWSSLGFFSLFRGSRRVADLVTAPPSRELPEEVFHPISSPAPRPTGQVRRSP